MLELINELNSYIFDKLAQDYEDEFSPTSGKKKNQDGKYSIDVDWLIPNVGYYWKEGSKIVSFSIIEYSEIVDFYPDYESDALQVSPTLNNQLHSKSRRAVLRSLYGPTMRKVPR